MSTTLTPLPFTSEQYRSLPDPPREAREQARALNHHRHRQNVHRFLLQKSVDGELRKRHQKIIQQEGRQLRSLWRQMLALWGEEALKRWSESLHIQLLMR